MMNVIAMDGITLQMDGGYHETLVWLPKGVDPQVEAEDVIRHELENSVLWQIKASTFVSLQGLNPILVKRLSPVLPVQSRKNMNLPFQSCTQMLGFDGTRETPLWKLAIEYENARGDFLENQVLEKMIEIVRILKKSIQGGLLGTKYDDRVLGNQSGKFLERMNRGELLDAGNLNRIILYVTAMMEVKSSMGVIVAAPTAGACAALPGAVIGMAECMGCDETEMAKAMLAAGLIGVFIATRWTFAAEVGGCQAEGGSAASMSSAA